jgi:hypothetical protein
MKYDFVGYTARRRYGRRTDREPTRRRRDARGSRDVSGGARAEYAHRGVATDGGTTDPEESRRFTPEPGARVRDREADPGEGELLVLDVLDARADEHLVEGTDKTVHEYNDGYRPDTPVVRAVYTSDLDSRTGWRSLQELRGRADEGELRAYDFPAARLGALPGGSRRDGAGDP